MYTSKHFLKKQQNNILNAYRINNMVRQIKNAYQIVNPLMQIKKMFTGIP